MYVYVYRLFVGLIFRSLFIFLNNLDRQSFVWLCCDLWLNILSERNEPHGDNALFGCLRFVVEQLKRAE